MVPVADLPYIDSLTELSMEERHQLGLYLPSGEINYYRLMKMKGQGASRTDAEWDKVNKIMTCCGSKVYWRHKTGCKLLSFDDESTEKTDVS